MNGPIVALAARKITECRRLRKENRRLYQELAAVHEVADVMERNWLEERAARVDLQLLHGWMGSEAT